jgi:hypothetical protein
VIDIAVFQMFSRVPCSGAKMLPPRRGSKNSGGGIAPAAIGGLIEGEFCTVNAFLPLRKRPNPPGSGGEVAEEVEFIRGARYWADGLSGTTDIR